MIRMLAVIFLLLLPQVQDEYKRGRPTSKGVDKYVERNEYQFVIDYQNHVGDTLFYEPFISSDDLTKYYHYTGVESGWFERPDNIIVNNHSQYIDYELSRLSRFRKSQYREATMFVRAVVMHELTHAYVYQIMMKCQYDKTLEYEWRQGLRMLPTDNWFTEFIEEGICEWVVEDMGEMIGYDEEVVLIKKDLDNRNSYEIKYRYSKQFVSPIIEEFGLEAAIYMVLSNAPPNREEVLNPKQYYDRLKWN